MIKKDIPIIKEFLGTTDVVSMVTQFKCCRCYVKRGSKRKLSDLIIILTPLVSEDEILLEEIVKTFDKVWGVHVKYTEHQRGKNKVYTFEKVDE